MANPQLEDGFTRIANEILEQLAKSKLSGLKISILLTVIRRSYGFQQKEAALSLSFLAKATGCRKNNVKKAIDELIADNYVSIDGQSFSNPRTVRFNKNWDSWECTPREIQSSQKSTKCTHTEVLGESPPGGTKKESNKKTLKENLYTNVQLEVLEFWNAQNIIIHSQTAELQKSIQNALKKHCKDDIVAAIDHYSTVLHDKDYFYSHIWRLDKFLKQNNGLPDFLDQGQQWINYQNKKGGSEYGNIPNYAREYGDHSQYAKFLDGN